MGIVTEPLYPEKKTKKQFIFQVSCSSMDLAEEVTQGATALNVDILLFMCTVHKQQQQHKQRASISINKGKL